MLRCCSALLSMVLHTLTWASTYEIPQKHTHSYTHTHTLTHQAQGTADITSVSTQTETPPRGVSDLWGLDEQIDRWQVSAMPEEKHYFSMDVSLYCTCTHTHTLWIHAHFESLHLQMQRTSCMYNTMYCSVPSYPCCSLLCLMQSVCSSVHLAQYPTSC